MTDAREFAGKTVLITGGAGGIGTATALVMAERGATVLLTDIDRSSLDRSLAALPTGTGEKGAYAADITSPEEVATLFEWAGNEFGGVDYLVNNAGILTQSKLAEFPDEDWDKVIAVNLTAAYRCTKAFARARIAAGRPGAIVNIASMAYKGMTQQIAYSSSKGAIVTMTKSTAMELARYGIRANAVAPGMTETSMITPSEEGRDVLRERMMSQIPLRRYAQPREMATIISFLLSEDSSYLTGEVLHASGGARL